MPTQTLAGPLDGIRVIDLTAVVLGPMATQVLADFGADVIKVEPPEGDLMRANGVSVNPGMSSIYLALNRNKRSVVLDLKQPDDAAALRTLIADADVLVHNMRIAAIERLHFGYAEVAAINPRIVYCAATGFGQEGPWHDRPAFDDIIQASCGMVGLDAVDGEAPRYVPSLVADKVCGLALANAVMAALVHHSRSGEGQYVEVPMLETMASFVLAEHMGGLTFMGSTAPAGYARLLDGGRRPVPTADGWISLLPYTGRHWRAFFDAVGREDVSRAYELSSREQLNRNVHHLYARLAEISTTRTSSDWLALCERLDIPATEIYQLDDLPRHPHLEAVGLFQQSQHPTEGAIRELRPAPLFHKTPARLRRHAPALGEHTQEVLHEAGIPLPRALPHPDQKETP